MPKPKTETQKRNTVEWDSSAIDEHINKIKSKREQGRSNGWDGSVIEDYINSRRSLREQKQYQDNFTGPQPIGGEDAMKANYYSNLNQYGAKYGDAAAQDEGYRNYRQAMANVDKAFSAELEKNRRQDAAYDAFRQAAERVMPFKSDLSRAGRELTVQDQRYARDANLYNQMGQAANQTGSKALWDKAEAGFNSSEYNRFKALANYEEADAQDTERLRTEDPAAFYAKTMSADEIAPALEESRTRRAALQAEYEKAYEAAQYDKSATWKMAQLQKQMEQADKDIAMYQSALSTRRAQETRQNLVTSAQNDRQFSSVANIGRSEYESYLSQERNRDVLRASEGFGDKLLRYFTEGGGVTDTTLSTGTMQASINAMRNGEGMSDHEAINSRLNELDDDMKELFYYWWNKDKEKALSFLEYGAEISRERQLKNIREWANDKPVLGTLAAAGVNLFSGADYLSALAEATATGSVGAHQPNVYLSDIRDTMHEGVTDNFNTAFGKFVYQVGTSMLDSAIGMSTGNTVPTFFLSAASSEYLEAKRRGASDEQALLSGTLSGLAECVFEEVSVEKLLSQNFDRGILLAVLQQAFTEASEEVTTTLANTISDIVLSNAYNFETKTAARRRELMASGMSYGEADSESKKEWLKEVLMDGLAGAASGGAMTGFHYVGAKIGEGVFKAADKVDTRNRNEKRGATIGAEEAQALRSFAEANGIKVSERVAQSTEENATENAPTTEQEAKLSRREIRQERKANRDTGALQTAVVSKLAETVHERGLNSAQEIFNEQTEQHGAAITRIVQQAIVNEARTVFAQAQNQSELTKAYQQAVETATAKPVKQALKQAYQDATTLRAYQGDREAMTDALIGGGSGRTLDLSAEIAAPDGSTQNVQIKALNSEKGKVVLDNGSTVTLDDLQGLDADTKDVVQRLDAFDLGEARPLAFLAYQTAVEKGDVTDGTRWVMSWALAFDQGRNGAISVQEAVKRSSLPEDVVRSAYELGEKQTETWRQAQEKTIAEKRKAAKEGATGRKGVLDTSALTKEQYDNLSADKKDALSTLELIAEATGVDIRLIAQKATKRGNVKGYQGLYNKGGNYIEIDVNAGINNIFEDLNTGMTAVLGHELTHWMQENAPTEYLAYKKAVLQAIMSTRNGELTLERMIEAQINQNKREGKEISRSQAEDEVVADASMKRLGDSEFWDAVADNLGEKKADVFAKIKEYISQFFNRVREIIGRASHTSEAAQIIDRVEADVQANLRRLYAEGIGAAMRNSAQTENTHEVTEIVDAGGEEVGIDDGNGHEVFSERTYEEGGRDALEDYLSKQVKKNRISQEEMDQIIGSIDQIYEYSTQTDDSNYRDWSRAIVKTNIFGKPIFSWVKANSEYNKSIDASLICIKRRTLDAVFDYMIQNGMFDDFKLGQQSIVAINDIIRSKGFEIACGLCYIDAKRYRAAMVAGQFAGLYNELVKSMLPKGMAIEEIGYFNYGQNSGDDYKTKGKGLSAVPDSQINFSYIDKVIRENKPGANSSGNVLYKSAMALKKNPSMRKLVSVSDFMSKTGFENVTGQNAELLKLYNAKKGTGGPKATEGDVQYLHEIVKASAQSFKPESYFKVGGLRVQSFSDYIPRLVMDYAELIGDLAAKKLPAHAYSKELMFALQFGMTGMKINMSLIPNLVKGGVAPGLDANGNYAWRDGQSFGSTVYGINESQAKFLARVLGEKVNGRLTAEQGFKLAQLIQNAEGYRDNCGTIAIGVSDQHIWKMLDDPAIRMIIPYHKSGLNHILASLLNVKGFTDYTNSQNTLKWDGEQWVKLSKDDKDFNFNEYMYTHKCDARTAAQAYLDWCEQNGFKPKFGGYSAKSASYNENADFTKSANYYKVLEDFNSYDAQTEAALPQQAVKAIFPSGQSAFGSMKELMKMAIDGEALQQARQDKMVPEIVKEIQKTLPALEAKLELTEKDEDKVSALEEWRRKNGYDEANSSLSTRSDTDYLAAVERGDMEAAQKMVDEAAKAAGYVLSAYHGTAEDFNVFRRGTEGIHLGNVRQAMQRAKISSERSGKTSYKWKDLRSRVWELGTETREKIVRLAQSNVMWYGNASEEPKDFDGDINSAADVVKYVDGMAQLLDKDARESLSMVLSTFDRDIDPKVLDLYAKIKNPLKVNSDILRWTPAQIARMLKAKSSGLAKKFRKAFTDTYIDVSGSDISLTKNEADTLDKVSEFEIMGEDAWNIIADVLSAHGYDGIQYVNQYEGDRNSPSYIALRPSDVKRAAPVTYDDNDNVIPLSQRFNPGENDMRYSTRDYSDSSDLDLLLNAADEISEGGGEDYWASLLSEEPGLANETAEIKRLGKQLKKTEAELAEAQRNLTLSDRKLKTRGIASLAATIMQDQKAGDINKKDVKNRITAVLTEAYQKALDQLDAGADVGTAWETVYSEGVVKAADILLSDATYAEKHGYGWVKTSLGQYLGEGAREYVEADIGARVAEDFQANRYRPGQKGTIADRLVAQAENRVNKKLDAAKTENAALKAENAKLSEDKAFFEAQAKSAKETAGELYQQLLDKREELKNNTKISAEERKKTLNRLNNLEKQMKAKRDEAAAWKKKAEKNIQWAQAALASKNEDIRAAEEKIEQLQDKLKKTRSKLYARLKKSDVRKMIKAAREREAKLIAEQKDERFAKYKEKQSAAQLRSRIKNLSDEMKRKMTKPTDGSYVPASLYGSMTQVADLLDNALAPKAGTKAEAKYRAMMDAIHALQSEYGKVAEMDDYTYKSEFDTAIMDEIRELEEVLTKDQSWIMRETGDNRSLREYSLGDLTRIYEILRTINESMTSAAHFLGKANFQSIWDAMGQIAEQQGDMTSFNRLGWYGKKKRMRMLDSLNVMRAVEMMSGWDRSAALYRIMQQVESGVDVSNAWMMEYNKAMQALKTGKNEKAYRDALTKKLDFNVTDEEGLPVQMTKMQALQLLMTAEREAHNDKLVHLQRGGATIRDALAIQDGKKDAAAQNIKVTPDLISRIQQSLTEWDNAYMKAVRDYFGREGKATNRVLYNLKHRVLQTEDYYVPYNVDKNYLDTNLDETQAMNMWVKTPGSTNALQKKASQPVIIDGMDTVMAKHVREIADYIGLAIPVRDFAKVYNGRLKQGEGENPLPVKQTVDKNWKAKGQHLLTQSIIDVQGGSRGASWSTAIAEHLNALQSAFVKSALLINPSVTIKQAASYAAAGSILSHAALDRANHPISVKTDESNAFDPATGLIGHIFFAPNGATAMRIYNEIDKYTSLHYMRRQGMSQAELANEANRSGKLKRAMNSVGASMEQTAAGHIARKVGASLNPVSWIQRMDVATTATLWLACKEQARMDGMKVGTEEYWQRVTELYERVIRETQPMYDSLHRNAGQKSRETSLMQYLFPFRTVPIQNHGQIAASYETLQAALKSKDEARIKEAKKFFAKTMWAQTESAIIFSLMSFIAAALKRKTKKYRDEDEEISLESILQGLGRDTAGTMVSNLFPLLGSTVWDQMGNIYDAARTGKKVWSYDTFSVGAVDMLNDAAKAIGTIGTDVANLFAGNDVSWDQVSKDIQDLLVKSMKCLGIPASTIKTYAEGMIGNVNDVLEGRFPALNDASWERSAAVNANRYLKAWIADDDAKLETVKAEMMGNYKEAGKDEEEANKAMKTKLTATAKDAFAAGTLDETDAILFLAETGYYDENEAWNKVRQWAAENEHEGDEEYKWNQYEDLRAAFTAGSGIEEAIKELEDHGYSDTQLANEIADNIRGALTTGAISEETAIDYLKRYRGMDEDKAWKKVQEWQAKAEHADEEDYSYSQYDAIDAAIDANKEIKDLVSELTAHGVKAESVTNHVKQHLVDNYVNGNVSETALRNQLSRYCGIVAKDDVDKIVNDAKCRKATGYAYSNLDEAYRAGEVSKTTMKNALVQYGGKTSEEADKKIRWWDLQVSKPNLDISESIANSWYDGTTKSKENGHESAKAAGMSIEAYMKAKAELDKISDSNGNNTGEDEVIAALAKMNLTPRQKDALYYERYKGTTKISKTKSW